MKYLSIIAAISLFLSSCRTNEERTIDSIKSFLTSKIENASGLKIIESSQVDFLYNGQRDSTVVAQYLNVLHEINEMQKAIDNFRTRIADGGQKIWLRTMPQNLKDAYQKIQLQKDKVDNTYFKLTELLDGANNHDQVIVGTWKSEQSAKIFGLKSLIIEFNANEEAYIGFFYFNNKSDSFDITGSIILKKEQTKDFGYITKHYINSKYESPSPDLEDYGIDIVPEDEDPTKTKEERELIKKKKIEEREQFVIQVENELQKSADQINDNTPIIFDKMLMLEGAEYDDFFNIFKTYYVLSVFKENYSTYQLDALKSLMKSSIKEQCRKILRQITASHKSKAELIEIYNYMRFRLEYIYKDLRDDVLFTVTIWPDDL